MSEDINFFEIGFKTVTGILIAIGGWLWNRAADDIRELKKQQNDCEVGLLTHKLEAEKTYAKEADMNYTLARLHTRLDHISEDIKELIQSVARQDGKSHH